MFLAATDDDVPAIVRLMNRAYRGAEQARGWSAEDAYIAGDRTTDAFLRAEMAAKPAGTLLKWVDEAMSHIRACVWLEPIDRGLWYLGSLAVDPLEQNGGLGRIVLAAAEDWARDRGARRVRMTVVNVREALIAWYGRRGYAPTGETEAFPYDDGRLGTPLRDDLCFTILEKSI